MFYLLAAWILTSFALAFPLARLVALNKLSEDEAEERRMVGDPILSVAPATQVSEAAGASVTEVPDVAVENASAAAVGGSASKRGLIIL